MPQLLHHIRTNAIAYVALFFAIGGGGGYALAATTGTTRTVHTCEVRKTGELLAKSRCDRAERPLSLDSGTVTVADAATPGLSAVSAYANIAPNGAVNGSKNMTVTTEQPGQFTLEVSRSVCPVSNSGNPSITVTPSGGYLPASASEAAEVPVGSFGGSDPQSFQVQVGVLKGGTYYPGGTPEDQVGASVQVDC